MSDEGAADDVSARHDVACNRVGAEPVAERGGIPLTLILGGMAVIVPFILVYVFPGGILRDDPMEKKRTIALLAEIEGGLEAYKFDHGTYPINPAEDREDAAIEGARVLYRYLSGDFDEDGKFDFDDPEAKIYVDSLDFQSSQKANKGTVGISHQGLFIATDSFGNPIRYLCDPPNRIVNGKREIRTLNPTYDLWSTGKARPGEDDLEALAKWFTNWGAQ